MESTDRYFLTHVPKTAGTSIRKSVFDHEVAAEDVHRFTGVRSALKHKDSFKLLVGHYPYGVHWLFQVDTPKYFVMLRDPVDRAVSHYYFVKSSDSSVYRHPSLKDVKAQSLSGLFRIPKYQNMQTRYIAGLPWEFVGRAISLNNIFGRLVLWRAKRNLINRYQAFGLKERFSESVRLFASCTGTTPVNPKRRHKKTPERPSVSDFSDDVVQSIRENNALDVALYAFAASHFRDQYKS